MKKTATQKKKRQSSKRTRGTVGVKGAAPSPAADVKAMVGKEKRAILQAILDKAKQGSYTHARFLFDLASEDEVAEAEDATPCEVLRDLVEELEAKHAAAAKTVIV